VDLHVESPAATVLDTRGAIAYQLPATSDTVTDGHYYHHSDRSHGTLSPSFSGQRLIVGAYLPGTDFRIAGAIINFSVQARVVIQIAGTGDDNWILGGQPLSAWYTTPGNRKIEFISHTTGLQVIFVNSDNLNSHAVFSGIVANDVMNRPRKMPSSVRPALWPLPEDPTEPSSAGTSGEPQQSTWRMKSPTRWPEI